ncbi:MAG: alpha-glucosidase [Anaerolineales bacterium]|nr:alpha-glucosidase [Anaerolineales bacterium]
MNTRTRNFLLLVASITLGLWLGRLLRPGAEQLTGRLTFDPQQVPSLDYTLNHFQIRWDAETGQLILEDLSRPGFALWQTLPGEAFILAAQGQETVQQKGGISFFRDQYLLVCNEQTLETIEPKPSAITMRGKLYCGPETISYSLNIRATNVGIAQLDFQLEAGPAFNRIFLTYASAPEEHFFGFGEQFSYFDMKGRRVPIWVNQQGIGRGDQPATLLVNLSGDTASGNPLTTPAPVPFYLTSQMRAVQINNQEYLLLDLERPDRVQVQAFANDLSLTLFSGETPEEILSTYANLNGTPLPLPTWIYSGAVIDLQGGSKKTQNLYRILQAYQIPIAAIRLTDWSGPMSTLWQGEVDRNLYPDWESMVHQFTQDGVRLLVSTTPYVAEIEGFGGKLFRTAVDQGYLVKTQAGQPYLFQIGDTNIGLIDLTNQEAFEWYKQILIEQMTKVGASAWIADLGGGLPYDAVLASGQAASTVHNMYPVLWAELNRQVAATIGEEIVFLQDTGYTHSPGIVPLFWSGEHLISWGKHNGIQSAVTALNTSGLSGFVFNHSEIGGSINLSHPLVTYRRSEELFLRWMEMNAFTLIFRLGEGSQPEKNIQFYSNENMFQALARWSQIYAALFDYRQTLITEAVQSGMPVVRHPFLHYPNDPNAWRITYQAFMLGSDFLVAPVTEPSANTVTVYLPPGQWTHLWSGKTYHGGQTFEIFAPVGEPAVFYLQGSAWGEKLRQTLEAQGLMP